MSFANVALVDVSSQISLDWIAMKKVSSPPKNTAGPSDASLNAAARDGAWMAAIASQRDKQALTQLFKIYGPKLKGWLMARGVGNGTAEDIVQDVMIKVWMRAEQFDPSKASFATWVYRLTRNQWIDHKRKHGRMDIRDPELMKLIADDRVSSAETDYIRDENADALRTKMKSLSDVQRNTLRMAYMEFKTHQEIADETGIPLGTVKTRIRSAITTLRRKMKDTEQ